MLSVEVIYTLFLIFVVCETESVTTEKYWEGNWFPNDPGLPDTNDVVNKTEEVKNENSTDLYDPLHGIKMGVVDKSCDDGKTNLTVDWDGSPKDYTCYEKKYKMNFTIEPLQKCDHIPPRFLAQHYCMNTTIRYAHKIPTFGDHRPLWPIYGEYKFVPARRWLHSLEHGGVVMLYHPCANKKEILKLKKIVRNCMWKHIIAANTDLTKERPIVLLTWGCSLYMNKVDEKIVVDFIKKTAMKGPEFKNDDGFYNLGLIRRAVLVSDEKDSSICPDYNFRSVNLSNVTHIRTR